MNALLTSFQAMVDALLLELPSLLGALITLLVTLFLARWLSSLAAQALRRVRGLSPSVTSLLTSVVRVSIIAFGLLAVLNVLGLGQVVISAIASLGIVGLVVGFALQDITKQFASGLMLTLARPFEIGDTIRVGTHEGTVTALELRSTSLRTAGGDQVIIPNADIYSATVYNLSRYPQHRNAVPIQFPYTADLEAWREALLAAVSGIPGIAATPPPSVVCLAVVDQKVNLEVRYWLARDTTDQDEISTLVIVAANRVVTTGTVSAVSAAQQAGIKD